MTTATRRAAAWLPNPRCCVTDDIRHLCDKCRAALTRGLAANCCSGRGGPRNAKGEGADADPLKLAALLGVEADHKTDPVAFVRELREKVEAALTQLTDGAAPPAEEGPAEEVAVNSAAPAGLVVNEPADPDDVLDLDAPRREYLTANREADARRRQAGLSRGALAREAYYGAQDAEREEYYAAMRGAD
jgi:hypothetical protein